MDKKILLKKLLEYFKVKDIPENLNEMKKKYKEIILSLDKYDIPEDILTAEDKYLRVELINKKLTDGEKYNTIDVNLDSKYKHGDKIALWQGDESTIYADVLINPVNEKFDLHKKNKVYMNAGMRLRKKCLELIDEKKVNPTEVLITRAYNLISDFIIHVVLPEDENGLEGLAKCYSNVLECADNNIAKTIVLSDISNKDSKEILLEEVMKYLDLDSCHIEKIIIVTDNDDEFEKYIELLDKYKETTE